MEMNIEISDKTQENIGMGILIGVVCLIVGVLIYGLLTDWIFTLKTIGVFVGLITATFGIAYVVIWLSKHVHIERKPKTVKKLQKPKEQNLAFGFLKAKKSKVCPILEFEEQ